MKKLKVVNYIAHKHDLQSAMTLDTALPVIGVLSDGQLNYSNIDGNIESILTPTQTKHDYYLVKFDTLDKPIKVVII